MTPDEVSQLMHRGIALLDGNTRGSLTEALECFDRAIKIRRGQFLPGDPWAGYLLAASWMNRGDALTRLGGAERLAEAVRSYDEALAALREVPPKADPRYRRRHAIAWINRGLSLHEEGSISSLAEAVRSFEQGMATVCDHPEHGLLLAGAWMNHGNALLRMQPVRAVEAQRSALAALALVESVERQEQMAAEISLKAQLVLCQSTAEQLSDAPDPEAALDQVCIATDAVEAGLRLARFWEDRGEACFDPLITSFLRFGVAIYRRYQPQFLAEFVLEHLRETDGAERLALAVDALALEARRIPPDGFASLDSPRFGRVLENLRVLRLAKERLRERA